MVDFLNTFNNSCSHRLFTFDRKINKIEAEMRLLEFKLNSIPGLQDEQVKPPSSENKQEEVEIVAVEPDIVEQEDEHPPKSEEKIDTKEEEVEVTKKTEVDPAVLKFVKMVQFGVPAEAVKLKMKSEGIDPDLLKM